ncbi:MAG: 2-dehydropantoate 2-reductase [Kofleriaceae bacterium]|nr:2-dehydropantoate 2-reductase [Kofleriaceae bacterium]MCL4227586.1 2-dehydropantoate 2-reductase [Myxococcales bacterium]
MSTRLRIAVIGAGSIGGFVGGKLLAADVADVVLVGRPRLRDELAAHGLTVRDLGRDATVAAPRLAVETAIDAPAVAACDAALVCVKSAQTTEVAAELARVLRPDAVIASLQNGVGNAATLRAALAPRQVLAAIVSFNVVSPGDGVFHRTMDGPIVVEAATSPAARTLLAALRAAGLHLEERADLGPDQWSKLVVNLNNAVSALSGAPTRQLLLSPGYRRVVAAVVDEALAVLRAAGLPTARFRGLPLRIMPTILRLPTPLVRVVTRAQMKVDPEARSSMWEDLTRGRPTEVDYLNGEIVRLAARTGVAAPLNRRIVELVHAAERAGPGSPGLGAAALWAALHARA